MSKKQDDFLARDHKWQKTGGKESVKKNKAFFFIYIYNSELFFLTLLFV